MKSESSGELQATIILMVLGIMGGLGYGLINGLPIRVVIGYGLIGGVVGVGSLVLLIVLASL
jgi:hypothetical protein